MKGFILVFWLALSTSFALPVAAQSVPLFYCEDCRGPDHPSDFGNHAFNQFYGPTAMFQPSVTNELVVSNLEDQLAYVVLELVILPFVDVWDEQPDYDSVTNEEVLITVIDEASNLNLYWVSGTLADQLGPLQVGPVSGGSPSGSGGSGGGEGSGGSGGAGFGGGSGSSGGSGGSGGGSGGCSVVHTDTETILTCYVN